MAISEGPFGDFTGRIGNVVFYKLKGKIISRTIGKVETRTVNQEEVLMRTSVISPFLSPLKEFIRIGFKNTPKPEDWDFYSMATSLNKPGAIKGKYPKLKVNYKKVILSKGAVAAPVQVKVSLIDKQLQFNWDPNLDAKGADASDQVMLVAYFPETLKAIFLTSGAKRKAGTDVLNLPGITGKTVIETYIAFINEDRSDVSNSLYSGQLIWNGGLH